MNLLHEALEFKYHILSAMKKDFQSLPSFCHLLRLQHCLIAAGRDPINFAFSYYRNLFYSLKFVNQTLIDRPQMSWHFSKNLAFVQSFSLNIMH